MAYKKGPYIYPLDPDLKEAQLQRPSSVKSLYAHYMKEREGAEVLEKPWGFATYKVSTDHIYLVDLYIIPSERKSGKGQELELEVANIGRTLGLKTMYGSISPSTAGAADMERIMLHLGYRLDSCGPDIIYYKKSI